MFCPKCGTSCGDNERFCPSCGTALDQQATQTTGPAPTPKPGKTGGKVPTKLIGIAAVAVVAIVVVVVLVNVIGGLFSGGGGGGGSYGSYSANAIQFVEVDGEYDVYAGTKKLDTVDNVDGGLYSMDASVAAFLDDGDLYVAHSKGVDKVDEDVAAFDLSANGAVVAYVNDEMEVYYYNVSKGGKPAKIGEGEDGVTLASISPDGSAIAFTTSDGGDLEGFLSKNGKDAESLGDDMYILAASNGGTYIYYVKIKDNNNPVGAFYVLNGKNETRLEKEISANAMRVVLNSDGSQLIYFNDGNTYLTVKGGESTKVSSGMMVPFGMDYAAGVQQNTTGSLNSGILRYSCSDFRGLCYVSTSNDVYYVDSKGESTRIASSVDGCALSSNGKSMIYLKNGDLVKVEDVSKGKNSKTVELTDEGKITSFVATADLSAVYYELKEDLYYQKGTGKAVSVGDDVDYFFMAADFSVCYIVSDGELYTSDGKAMVVVKGLDDVSRSYTGFYKGVCFFAQKDGGEYELYVATGNKPKQLDKDVSRVLN